MTPRAICELLAEEVDAWVARERARRPGATRAMLLDALAGELELENARQIYRYMAGDTPFPLAKVLPFCRTLGSWKLLQVVCQAAGMVAAFKPDVGHLTGYDLVVEQARGMKECADLAVEYARAIEHSVSEETFLVIQKEAREAIQQIDRLVALYGAMVGARKGAA